MADNQKTKVVVLIQDVCKITHEQVEQLLKDAKLDVDEEVVIATNLDEISKLDVDGHPLLLIIDDQNCNDTEAEQIARQAAAAGAKVFVIFGEGFDFVGLHPIAKKYGTQCGWSAKEISDKISAEDDNSPTDTTGEPQTRVRPDQVKC